MRVTATHSANLPGISCILLTNLAASGSGRFKGPLGQIIVKQQFPFAKKGFLCSDLDYLRFERKLEMSGICPQNPCRLKDSPPYFMENVKNPFFVAIH